MSIRSILVLLYLSLIQTCFHPVYSAVQVEIEATSPFAWKITKAQWSTQDEKSFQEFVARIGEAIESRSCSNVTDCMNGPANTYRKSDPPGLLYRSDCADFPYFLRTYFAWKNGLPFSFAIDMKLRDVPGNDRDVRYSRYGNEVAERYTTASSLGGRFKNAQNILNNLIPDMTSSANYRTHYADDHIDLFTDFYPIRIDREAIHPGTLIYDPNGHVAMVYKVTEDGKALYMDAHPDNGVTTGTYGSKYVRSNPGQGAGFKNWRPLKLVGAQLNSHGIYLGGKVMAARNAELADYSIEQFFGNAGTRLPDSQWSQGQFLIDGKPVSYYDYVRQNLSVGLLRINPVDEFSSILKDVCDSLKDRVEAVDVALKAGIQNHPHPERLPENIYGTEGEWESYSTPSRDAQLKVSFVDLLTQSRDFIEKWKNQNPTIVYSGANLAQDLMEVYQRDSVSCEISYMDTDGGVVNLNLEQVRLRLFKLSFDPYHCVELRWGAQSAQELQSCRDNENKRLWYEREQRLRNQHIRQYDAKMDFTLEDLLKPLPGNGVENPPDVDILGFLNSQAQSLSRD